MAKVASNKVAVYILKLSDLERLIKKKKLIAI